MTDPTLSNKKDPEKLYFRGKPVDSFQLDRFTVMNLRRIRQWNPLIQDIGIIFQRKENLLYCSITQGIGGIRQEIQDPDYFSMTAEYYTSPVFPNGHLNVITHREDDFVFMQGFFASIAQRPEDIGDFIRSTVTIVNTSEENEDRDSITFCLEEYLQSKNPTKVYNTPVKLTPISDDSLKRRSQ